MAIRKRAGATDQDGVRSGATAGMSNSMKERAKEALAGRTGETDDEEEDYSTVETLLTHTPSVTPQSYGL